MNQKEVLIIIPAYNESANIAGVLEQLQQDNISKIADVLVMNDYSKDDTKGTVKKYNETVISHVYNLGYGSGLQSGYKYAIRKNYKYVIQMDADGQHDICNIIPIYEELKRKDEDGKLPDIVLGSRFLNKYNEMKESLLKRFAIQLFRMIIYIITHKKISDPTSGLQGLSHRTVLFYSKFSQFDDKYPDANMIVQMLLLGYNIREIPAVMHLRSSGESMHSGLKPIVYMIRMFISICAVWVREKILHLDERVGNE